MELFLLSGMNAETTPLSCSQASDILNISQQRVRALCKSGEIEASRLGRTWLIDEASVESYGMQSGHVVAEDHAAYNAPSQNKPIALSFFSGAMGMDLGLEEAGFHVQLACEFDKFCRQTIAINKPNTALLGDINEYEASDIRKAAKLSAQADIDLIVGGPPCQAFSTAGKRQGLNDTRGNVFLKYLDLAIELNPKFIVIENVRGLLSCPMEHRPHEKRGEGDPELSHDEIKGGALNHILTRLQRSGYSYSFNLYNAANFGSPQVRERVIIICSRELSEVPYLVPTHSMDGDFNLPKWKTFRDCVKGLKKHNHLNFPEKRLKFYRMLKSGQNWKNLPVDQQKEAMGKSFYSGGGKTGFLRRLAWDKPSPTVVTHPAMPATDLAHPKHDRPLSVEEYKRIQEFPDRWEIAGPLIQQYKQVGNAVPSSLGKAVGDLILHLLKGESIQQIKGFPYSRYRRTSHTEWEADFEPQIAKLRTKENQAELSLC